MVLNATYDLTFGKGRRLLSSAPGLVNQALGGWQVGLVSYFQSGQYFTPSFSGSDPSKTNTFGGLPDRIADGHYPAGQRDRNATPGLKFVIQGMFTNIGNHPLFDFRFSNISVPASVARTYQLREGGTGGRSWQYNCPGRRSQ